MKQSNEYARTRGLATVAAQVQVAGTWVWDEKTVAGWNADLAAVNVQEEAAQDAEADADGARGGLNAGMDALASRAKQILALAKVRYRFDELKLTRFAKIRFESDGRMAIMEDALSVESAWEKSDAAWVPLTGVTLAVFKTQREAMTPLIKADRDMASAWSEQEKMLDSLCETLHANNVAWYAAATRVFPDGTPHGNMIRATIPTTYSPQPLPQQAIIAVLESTAPGEIFFKVTAEGATSFNLYQQAPGAGAFVEVAHGVPSGEYSASGQDAGEYFFKGEGVNSAGTGPSTEELSLVVG